MTRDPARPRLYLLTPPELEPRLFAETLKAALGAGDVAALQLRLKGCPDDAILEAGRLLQAIAADHGVAFIVNDRPDLAAMLGAEGVHLGQEDTPIAEARARLGAEAIIGASAHASRHLAMTAGEAGADYVAFGAFHPTTTKEAPTRAEPEILNWWSETFVLPCVAIGGITVHNAAPLLAAGADFLAVSAGVWRHEDGPAAAVRRFNRLMDQARP